MAPFYADVDNSVGDGRVWYRLTSNATLLSQAKADIPVALSGPNFNPQQLLIATWDHVGYFQKHTDKVCGKLCSKHNEWMYNNKIRRNITTIISGYLYINLFAHAAHLHCIIPFLWIMYEACKYNATNDIDGL